MAIRAHLSPIGRIPEAGPGRHILATVTYGATTGLTVGHHGNPDLAVPMAVTAGDPFTEVWTVSGRPRWASRDDLAYAHDGSHLFVAGVLPEQDVYTPSVRALYEKAFALVNHLDYGHIFRMWNFVGDIVGSNAEGMEIYQDFVRGRAQAFHTYMGDSTAQLPAATGIGTQGRGIAFLLLATRSAVPRHLENSRQTAAYHYPGRYGPKPPSFARATVLDDVLYVSGTASILGHETVHRGDVRRQTQETLANIGHLISRDNLAPQGARGDHDLKDLRLVKAYVRREADMDEVRAVCEETLGSGVEVRYLNVAVCRDDLLVEIEGLVPGPEWEL
ncbi:FkbO/Hyg5 family chorismatase [Streptomyces sp. VRA16 Mangrove soil]|uniref:FkbO/Hyg5 family chorismatase n=1 Tax=Streptomyces sp. VRA16 Mangrove soil TaxID=2817434 RepID=UPI001A9E6B10|nr:FkbO/Hyg5 family chorismatase [Streptomyces sp. VRA16 Mangrove soil]MBO1337178.1 reactive intermediate/imine deaminase [Streptomyces sp. VRA16 Mangrove soil]